ncbi:MAG: diacylglycerol kinase [Parashewanella sp.]
MSNQSVGLERIIKAWRYSVAGLTVTWKNEAAFRQELVLFGIATVVTLLIDATAVERVLLISSLGLVLVVELINSAIEACIDRIGSEYHQLSGAAKDIGSAAVLISLMLAAITWLIILIG